MSRHHQYPEYTLSTRPDARSVGGLIIARTDTDKGWLERSNGIEWQPWVEADIDSNDAFVSLMVRNEAVAAGPGGGTPYGNIDGGTAPSIYGGTLALDGGGA